MAKLMFSISRDFFWSANDVYFLLLTIQFLQILNGPIPSVNKLKSYHAGVDVTVTEDVWAKAGSYGHVVGHREIQRET